MQQEYRKCLQNAEEIKKLREVVKKHKDIDGALIPVLHEAQQIFGYLPLEVQLEISKGLGISLAEVYGVVSFYTQFFISPKGQYKINVCMGTACYVKGAGEILDKFKERLGINMGEYTEDGKFSLESCRCIGACGLAPVVTINDKVYGKLTPDLVDGILNEYKTL